MTYYSGLCSTPIWDNDITWNTSNPNFTVCFQNTVLTIIPFVVALCGLLFDLYRRKIYFWTVSWNFYNITCLLASLLIIALKLVVVVYSIMDFSSGNQFSSTSTVASPIIFAVSYIIAMFWKIHLQRQSIVSSGGLFVFWTVSFLCEFVRYRTYVMNILDEHILQNNLAIIGSSIACFPLVCLIFVLNIISDTPSESINLKTAKEIESLASYPSRITFRYVFSLIKKGRTKDNIYSNDIWDIEDDEKSEALCKVFMKELKHEKKKSNGKVKIVNILFRLFFKTYTLGFFLRFASDMVQFFSPFILQIFIGYINSNEPLWKGILYAILLVVPPTMRTIFIANFFYIARYMGLKIRAMMTAGIFHKGLIISSSAKQRYSVGEMVNLMAVDSQKFIEAFMFLPQIIIAPITFALGIYFLWGILGPSCLAGVAVLFILVPINAIAITIAKKLQRLIMVHSDQRLKLINEILNGIKVLKMYAWENAFANEIQGIRENEVKVLSKNAFIMALATALWTCASVLMTVASYAVFVLTDDSNVMTPSVAFVSLTLFNIIRIPLITLPRAISSLIELGISIKRLTDFINESELNLDSVEAISDSDDAVEMKDASFTWGEQNEAATIADININVKKGSLVAIVGKVGSGKSSLISALLGDMTKKKGTVRRKGEIAYVPQQAWIQNATVRNNITFYKKYKSFNYNKVIDACALRPDFELFLAGDMTEIGEKGVNLSGGQKQRISIARAVYNDADVYVLDDPLSAVDAHVGKHIFEKVIGPKGMLAAKTRILSTNSLSFLSQCDQVMVMNDGLISECGTYKELIANDGAFSDLIIQHLNQNDVAESDIELIDEILEDPTASENLKKKVRNKSLCLSNEVESLASSTDDLHFRKRKSNLKKVKGRLIADEGMEVGKVKFAIYWGYLKQMGKGIALFCSIAWVVYIICNTLVNIWLSNWSNDSLNPENYGNHGLRDMRLIVYCIGALCQVTSMFVALFMLCFGALRASKRLHNKMLENIIRSPMSFFDTTPIGRIMNRFSKDINILDVTLLNYMQSFSTFASNLIASLVIIVTQSPLILLVMLPLSLIFIYIQRLYLNISRQLKRIESISRSPIYSIFSESLSGSSSIRAYNMESIIANEFYDSNDVNQKAYHCTFLTSAWLEVTSGLMTASIIITAALFSLFLKDTIGPSEAGLAISFAINMTGMFILSIQGSAEIETNIVSGERILEYTMLESEAEWKIEKTQVDDDWPHNGTVEFNNYTTRYRPELDLVLKGIDCKINPGEKIGICGRTGAGKSSLTLALFRIIEAASGSIRIDDHDISKLGLHDLRANLTIIPQDPVLFTGALRFNLDPFSSYSDEKIWKTLDLANLKPYVTGLPEGLQSEVSEGGSNMSVGQRQLVCLARALLRKTKVLLLDEATAAVDLETDQLIQETIRKEFSDCTVITIAHRLNTTMDSSRVMVLSDGVIVEFDSPQNLLDNESSYFYSMVKDSAM